MQTINEVAAENQAAEEPIQRKIGIEIVYSANLSSRFFHGPSRFRSPVILGSDDDWRRRVERASRQ
jgi:hypothetical protein